MNPWRAFEACLSENLIEALTDSNCLIISCLQVSILSGNFHENHGQYPKNDGTIPRASRLHWKVLGEQP